MNRQLERGEFHALCVVYGGKGTSGESFSMQKRAVIRTLSEVLELVKERQLQGRIKGCDEFKRTTTKGDALQYFFFSFGYEKFSTMKLRPNESMRDGSRR
ncbi:hypothetical protein CAAN1_05S03972 [[Candida] anglica]|uniref:Uncharacterized protein n=1 Tax=[Candida] anglica TaxID=148631 RepID=A0ABP0ECZ2_9ASCO